MASDEETLYVMEIGVNGVEITCAEMSGVELTQNTLESESLGEGSCSRAVKRQREMDQNEVWSIVGRKGKRQARIDSNNSELIISQEKFEVSISSNDKLLKQIALARMLKAENIQNIVRVKYVNQFKAFIQFDDDINAAKLLSCKSLLDKGFRLQKTYEIGKSFGIIRDIDLDLTDDQLKEMIKCDTPILSVRRQRRRNFESNEWEMTEVVQVCFSGPSLPSCLDI